MLLTQRYYSKLAATTDMKRCEEYVHTLLLKYDSIANIDFSLIEDSVRSSKIYRIRCIITMDEALYVADLLTLPPVKDVLKQHFTRLVYELKYINRLGKKRAGYM